MFIWLASYRKLDRPVLNLITAEFFIQLINAAYFLLFNFYLLKNGYSDGDAASFLGWRFLAVMFISLPLGLYIRTRMLMPLFKLAALIVPLSSLLIIWAVAHHHPGVIALGNVIFGLSVCCTQICMLPYIMRNTAEHRQAEAIALHFITWSATTCCLGVLFYGISHYAHVVAGEGTLLTMTSLVSMGGFCLLQRRFEEKPPLVARGEPLAMNADDMKRIGAVMIPAIIIAIGAGLMVPFVNIFFYMIHGLDYDGFALLSAFSTFIVSLSAMYVPQMLRRYGYGVSVTMTQSLAVVALLIMASTEAFRGEALAVGVAMAAYLCRQPLMNMANPVIAQFTMNFVGEDNRELTVAIQQAMGSGCGFFSAYIFALLRGKGLSFTVVFSITAVIYALGIVCYHFLIREMARGDKLSARLEAKSQ